MHLSSYQINRYRHAGLAPAELLAVDDHLVACEFCRQQLRASKNVSAAMQQLQASLRSWPEPLHVSPEQRTAFVQNRLDAVERELVTSHLQECSVCAAQIQFMQNRASTPARTLRDVMAQAWAFLHERAVLIWPMPVAALIVVVLVTLVDQYYFRPGQKQSAPEIVRQQPEPVLPTPLLLPPQPGEKQIAKTMAPPNEKVPRLVFPSELRDLSETKAVTRSSAKPSVAFNLDAPLGTLVLNPRPTFRWQRLPGATNYTVKIFTTDYELVAESHALTTNVWTPPTALRRGQTYLWQVIATKDEQEISGQVPNAAEAKFKVLSDPQVQTLKPSIRNASTPLARGIVYARFGLLDEAESEFKAATKAQPNSVVAKKFLQKVQAQRNR